MNEPTQGAEPELPPELAELDRVAAAADERIGASLAPPPAPGTEDKPPRDPAAELAGLASLVVRVGGKWQPLIPKFYTGDVLQEAAAAYVELADKHGWKWHKEAAGPEMRLAGSLLVPGLLLLLAIKEQRQAEADKAKAATNTGERLAPGGLPAVIPH